MSVQTRRHLLRLLAFCGSALALSAKVDTVSAQDGEPAADDQVSETPMPNPGDASSTDAGTGVSVVPESGQRIILFQDTLNGSSGTFKAEAMANGSGDFAFRGNKYIINMRPNPSGVVIAFSKPILSDENNEVEVDVDALTNAPQQNIILLKGDIDDSIRLFVSTTSGRVRLMRTFKDESGNLQTKIYKEVESTDAVVRGKDRNHLSLRTEETKVTGFINGAEIISYDDVDPKISTGKVGLGAFGPSNVFITLGFSNLIVSSTK